MPGDSASSSGYDLSLTYMLEAVRYKLPDESPKTASLAISRFRPYSETARGVDLQVLDFWRYVFLAHPSIARMGGPVDLG